jgi:hypothetical protein
LNQLYKTPEGQAVEFFSPLQALPRWGNNWQKGLAEWTILPLAKASVAWILQKGSSAIGSMEFWSITSGEAVTVSAPTAAAVSATKKGLSKMAPWAIGAATALDVLAHAQCTVDPNLPPEGIPVGPK